MAIEVSLYRIGIDLYISLDHGAYYPVGVGKGGLVKILYNNMADNSVAMKDGRIIHKDLT